MDAPKLKDELPMKVASPKAYLLSVYQRLSASQPKVIDHTKEDKSVMVEPSPQSDDAQILNLLSQDPQMSASVFYNLLKVKGFAVMSIKPEVQSAEENIEADSGSSFPGSLKDGIKRLESSPSRHGNINFNSTRFLETVTPLVKGVDGSPQSQVVGFTKFKVVLLQEGLGNFADANYYSKEALISAIPQFEGAKIYADHPSTSDEYNRPERTVRDILGHFESVHIEESEDGRSSLVGEVCIVSEEPFRWARALMEHAVLFSKKFPDKEFIGLSINANGDANKMAVSELLAKEIPASARLKIDEAVKNGAESIKYVSSINSAVSCDLVTTAGAGGKVLNLLEGDMEKENQEGGIGSGRRPGGGKGDGQAKRQAAGLTSKNKYSKPAAPKKTTDDYLKIANDFEKSGGGFFSRAGKGGTDLHVNVRNGDWSKANDLVKKFGGGADAQPDAISGTILVKVPNAYKNIKNESETKMDQDPSKLKSESAEDAVNLQDEKIDHPDAAQDADLIKKMISKYMTAGDQTSEEECGIVKEAYEACKEMGMADKEAEMGAINHLKLAKHLAGKKAAAMPAEEKAVDADAAQAIEAMPNMESEEDKDKVKESMIKLTAENSKLKESLRKIEVKDFITKTLTESKIGKESKDAFRDLVKDAKSVEDVTKAWKLFEAAIKSVAPVKNPMFEDLSVTLSEKAQPANGKASLFDDISK